MHQGITQLRLETEMAKAETKELIYVHAESETTAKLLPGNEHDNKRVSFLQPQVTPNEDRSIHGETAGVEAKLPDVHVPRDTSH